MNKYNLDKLVKIRCNDFYPSLYYTFKKEKKILGLVIRKEGIYCDDYLELDVPLHHVLKDGIVYENPEVVLYYDNNETKKYYFDSYNEAKEFFDKITSFGRWIS